jgi:hypothetical protein
MLQVAEAVVGVWIHNDERLFKELFDFDTFYIGRDPCLRDTEDCYRRPRGGAQDVGPHEDLSGPGHGAYRVVR